MQPGIDYIGITVTFRCHDGKGNFLMHKRGPKCRDEHGRWDFGGGKLEYMENPEEATIREVYEEYGIKGTIDGQFPPYTLIRENNGVRTHWLVLSFFVKADISKAKIMEPGKAAELGIFRLDNLPTPLHSAIHGQSVIGCMEQHTHCCKDYT